jgi:hypothetical protein
MRRSPRCRDALAAIRGVWGEFGEALEGILAQRSRFSCNARFALALDVGDATIDRVNQFPKVTFQGGLYELGVREVDHQALGQHSSAPRGLRVSQTAQPRAALFTLEQT